MAASQAECKKLKTSSEAAPEAAIVVDDEPEEQEKVKALAAELRELQKTPELARKRWAGYEQVPGGTLGRRREIGESERPHTALSGGRTIGEETVAARLKVLNGV